MNASAIVNTFTSLGYKVVTTTDSVFEDADAYFLLLTGGPNYPYVADLPDYVLPLLQGLKPVFVQPTFGIPDNNDGGDWIPLREYFGLAPVETQTLANSIPGAVEFEGDSVYWGGIQLHLTPIIEQITIAEIDTSVAKIALLGKVLQEDIVLIIRRGNTFLINSNLIHMDAFYILAKPLDGPVNISSLADIVINENKALIFAEHDTEIQINLPWSGRTQFLRYDQVGDLISSDDIMVEEGFATELSQGEFIFLVNDVEFLCGDSNSDGFINIGDVVYLVNLIFHNGPMPATERAGDVNCDANVNLGDAVYTGNFIFQNNAPAPCADCPLNFR